MPHAILHAHIRRSYGFIALIVVLALAVVATATFMSTRSAKRSLRADIERELYPSARNGVGNLRLWYSGVRAQTSAQADADVIRLYTSEAMLLARTGNPSASEGLAVGRSLMGKQLQSFVTNTRFSSGRLINNSLQDLFTTEEHPEVLSKEQSEAVRAVLATGQPGISPVRATRSGLLVDILEPVFAPSYMTEDMQSAKETAPSSANSFDTTTPVGVLLFTCDISPQVREMESNGQEKAGRFIYLVQQRNGIWQDVRPDGLHLTDSSWDLFEGRLPLGVRHTNGEDVYALGLPVPRLPWLVVQTINQPLAEAHFTEQAHSILLVAACSAAGAVLLIWLAWWFAIGHSNKIMHTKTTELSDIVNQQSQLLARLEDALPISLSGMALTDTQGRIVQTNTALASMLKHTPKALHGMALISLFPPPMPEALRTAMARVLHTREAEQFTCPLQLPGLPLAGLPQNGETLCRVTCSLFLDAEGNSAGVITVLQVADDVKEVASDVKEIANNVVNSTQDSPIKG